MAGLAEQGDARRRWPSRSGSRALFAALSAAGAILDRSIGFSLGGVVDPLTGTQSSLLQQLYAMIGVMVFIAIGGDSW